MNYKTACELLKLPRDCHCQRTRGVPISSLNETRLRCRQFTKITTDYHWSIVPYDRLAFETPNDNLTLYRLAFADIRARTLRFNVQNLFLNDHAFENAYIGQLAISHTDNDGLINFELNGQIFYGTTITNIYIKSIDFQTQISEIILSNARVYRFLIESSKFYGFTNKKFIINQQNETNSKNNNQYDNFLEYDTILTTNSLYLTSSQSSPLKIHRMKNKRIIRQIFETNDDNSSLPEETVMVNITSSPRPAFVTIYTILSSINTTNLTENYFPNNLEYRQTNEIELSHNYIYSIDAYAFRHLQFFEGRLILTYNHIQYISPYAFTYLYSLKNLSLANNYIQNLSLIHFENLNKLYEIDLSFNQIYDLRNNIFQYLYNLHILHLNNNPLKFIDSNIFTNLIHLKELHLQGIPLIQLIDPQYSHWIWNLASLHVDYVPNTKNNRMFSIRTFMLLHLAKQIKHVVYCLCHNFALSDFTFCLLSRFNGTFFHVNRHLLCPCNVYYLSFNSDIYYNITYSTVKYYTNYLRITPICILNKTISNIEQYQYDNEQIQYSNNNTNFIFRSGEDKCNYKLMFLDCDAMTTTTTTTTTTIITTTSIEMTTLLEMTYTAESLLHTTPDIPISTSTPWYFKYTKPPKSVNNAKKLFTVLGTLIAITLGAIILVICWYRLKTIYTRKEKRKKTIEQQRNFNLPPKNNNNALLTAPRYASSDMLSSVYSTQLAGNTSQSQTLIAPASPPSIVYKNVDAITNDAIQNYIDEENQQQQQPKNVTNDNTTEIQATTQC
ncbi:unnamed protein product [Rotaria sp. Silwood1]|nr:unnamed protein product [Rotaria sp. Silwood1]CAF1066495.1 unnamed protein product [Rotaria sp. Silwood1]CAF4849611.1 unnamed protein product [Rotaria sp. Silwood1]